MEANRYFMAQEQGDDLSVVIYGNITSWPWQKSDVSSWTLSQVLASSTARRVVVHINSNGGDVKEGLAIFNQLLDREEVITVCDGFACSIASTLFMAGTRRIMRPASLLMVHNAWTAATGNADDLRKAADDLELINNTAVKTYRDRVKLSDEDLKILLDNETFIAPEQALKWGFATEISQKITAGGPMQSAGDLIFSRLTAVPQREQVSQLLERLNGSMATLLERLNGSMATLLERIPAPSRTPEPPAPLDLFQAFRK